MRLVVFASGSAGNCALVQGGGQSVLIDAGISAKRIREGLAQAGVDPQSLDGIFITHEHSDHIAGLSVFTRQFPLPVYAPGIVASALCQTVPGVQSCIRPIPMQAPVTLGALEATAFPTPHDTPQSAGYLLRADGASLAVATDTGCVTDAMLRYLSGADTVLIEANHDEAMLKNGPYPAALKRRILADTGHLSNAECARLAAVLVRQGTRQIILGHLSEKNNVPGLAERTVARALEGSGVQLFVAPKSGFLEVCTEPCFT